ncbi:hypothetical protein TSUD_409350 [Trifolium subterraneum]|uniref:RNase H type-1 domain-containing protein n=1 Tax=Trifolium subterraneum TaxID=3900 RepID=A0A2Z6PIL5_TRISU|nr:hypothetical protein TSUD_409350 [Trifolium subterraneum]
MQITRDKQSGVLQLTQAEYTKHVLQRFNTDNAKLVSKPLASHFRLSKDQSPQTEEERESMANILYASSIGSLMYAMVCTRADIGHAVGVVSKFMSNPGKTHWKTVKWILRTTDTFTGFTADCKKDTSMPHCCANSMIQDRIPSLVSPEDNNSLIAVPSDSEIKIAVFDMNGNGAPGPDRFGGHFYQQFWDIVAFNVIYTVQSFFLTGNLPLRLNSNILILIPKTPETDRIENFHPIALANSVADRHIADCVIIASEAINVLSKKSYAGNIALKIDIRKAFDMLDWNFLLSVLKLFVFSDTFFSWIDEILHSARLSVLVNGVGSIPFNHLGCPIIVGKPKVIHFKAIADRIKVKLASWKGALLSIMGLVQLVLRAIIHGNNIDFWLDNWLHNPLAEVFNFSKSAYHLFDVKVLSFIENGEWRLPTSITQQDTSIQALLSKLLFLVTHLRIGWIWYSLVPPSTSFIAWRCFPNKMPMDENLVKRGCIVVFACALCLSHFESTSHLFLSAQIWMWLGSLLHIGFNTRSFHAIFESLDATWSPLLMKVATAAVLHVFHSLWLARNGIRIHDAKITTHAAKIKILSSIKLSASLTWCTRCSSKVVFWRTLSIGWMKVNTDGSVVNSSAASGGLFRDYMANFRGGFAQKISGLSVLHAELMALILAMELAHSKQYLWLESDSLTVLCAFDNLNVVPSDLRNRWSNCVRYR